MASVASANPVAASRRRDSPWRFLEALDSSQPEDIEILKLTRGPELEVLTNLILTSKTTLFYAFSGNGKSSMINAGIIPHFHKSGYAVFKTRPRPAGAIGSPSNALKDCILREAWLPLTSPQDEQLLARARAALIDLPPAVRDYLEPPLARAASLIRNDKTIESARAEFLERLQPERGRPMVEFMASVQEYIGPEVPVLLICDQFEELFVHYYNTPAMTKFVAEIGEVVAASKTRARVLFSMREDWVGSMVEFRQAIPDIFAACYKLEPIRVSQATPAVSLPLERIGITVESELPKRLLTDLSSFYSVLQKRSFTSVHLTPSRDQDPYIELPALQVIMERLWASVDVSSGRMRLSDYESLAPSAPNPSETVLSCYLEEFLQSATDTDPAADRQYLKELRLDLLYLLTDRTAHRRAVSQRTLLSELQQMRPPDLLPDSSRELTSAEIQMALQPLIQERLVNVADGQGGAKECELAHDFLVRSVVSEWDKLDRRRTEERALLAERNKESAGRLRSLVQRERFGAKCIVSLALISFATVALSTWVWQPGEPNTLPMIICSLPLFALLNNCLVMRAWAGFCYAAFGLEGVVAIFVGASRKYGYGNELAWGFQNALLVVLLVCMLVLLLPVRSSVSRAFDDPPMKARRYAILAAECFDYFLLLVLLQVVAQLFEFDVIGETNSVYKLWLGLVLGWVTVQTFTFLLGRATVGYLIHDLQFGPPKRSDVQRKESPPRGWVQLTLMVSVNLAFISMTVSCLVWGVQFTPSRIFTFFGAHLVAVVLLAAYILTSERGRPFWNRALPLKVVKHSAVGGSSDTDLIAAGSNGTLG
jgi:hypothetical protein